MILDRYPIPRAIRFGRLASLLLREPCTVPTDECRGCDIFYVSEVELDEISFLERRRPMETSSLRGSDAIRGMTPVTPQLRATLADFNSCCVHVDWRGQLADFLVVVLSPP